MQEEERYTKDDILEFLKDGQSLEEADLRGSALREIELYKADLRGADLSTADLRDANLRGANLEGATLQNANLIGADLTGANLRNANLENAKLERAILDHVNLEKACLKKANLYYAIMKNAYIPDADFTEANLQKINLNGVEGVSSAIFDRANLWGARVKYTGLDAIELQKVGATAGSRRLEYGWKKHVFVFFKTSWAEFFPSFLKKLLAPVRGLFLVFAWFFSSLFKFLKKPIHRKKTSQG